MFGDLAWPINASRRFVSISWASCFLCTAADVIKTYFGYLLCYWRVINSTSLTHPLTSGSGVRNSYIMHINSGRTFWTHGVNRYMNIELVFLHSLVSDNYSYQTTLHHFDFNNIHRASARNACRSRYCCTIILSVRPSVRPSVCLSVCLLVQCRYCV